MKQYTSLLMLYTRSTFYKLLLLIFGIMAGLETALFVGAFRELEVLAADPYLLTDTYRYQNVLGLGNVFTEGHIQYVFAVAFVGVMAILMCNGCEFGSRAGYTYRRLGISRRAAGILQAVYNAMCLVMLWAVQVVIVLGLCKWYNLNAPAEYVTNQSVLVSLYNNDFLHSLIPLDDVRIHVFRWVEVVCLAVTAACFPIRQRRGEKGIAVIIMTAAAVLSFPQGIGGSGMMIMLGVGFVIVACVAVGGVWEERLE